MAYSNTSFKNGMIPWNKGLVGVMVAWNKGIKYKTNRDTRVMGVCKTCKLEFKVYKCLVSKRMYCSKKCVPCWNKGNTGYLAGEKHYKWKKDRTKVKIGDRSLNDPLQKQWRKAVKDKDGWTCRIADNNCDGRLEAHHILRWKSHPELRYEVNNGITLCHFHHPRKINDEVKLSPYFQELVKVN